MAKTQKTATPSHRAVGRVVRALTYPIISAEFDLTLRELNALATLSHVPLEMDNMIGEAAEMLRKSTFDAMALIPGCQQAFWMEEQFNAATDKLAELGLVTIENTHGPRMHLRIMKDSPAEGPGRVVRLTKAGEELVDSMAGNLAKSLSLLDTPDVRDDLALYS
ncbi:hypothetical protein [Quatrionicoccus australiensis]|uniref:hypothetical protein n=1 Tax=Quatrionicoccus australiensis TaxID=138118 RepID=UPI001CF9ECEF|nr:hypothetical protein [Quatrionicoccus australiensis]MCB4359563.1 hypothetical protein [Quatrionicoccus australiensis]